MAKHICTVFLWLHHILLLLLVKRFGSFLFRVWLHNLCLILWLHNTHLGKGEEGEGEGKDGGGEIKEEREETERRERSY